MFYTYLWFRENATPYYVGKGRGKRAYDRHAHRIHRPVDRARIFIQHWESEEKAFEMERWYILLFGRKDLGTGILQNRTDGGEGPAGYSEEHLKAMRDRMLGKPSIRKGTKCSEETRKLISAVKLGKKPSEEALRNMSKAQLGRKHTKETKEKIADSNRRRTYSEKTLEKMRNSQRVGESGHKGIIWDGQVSKWKVRVKTNGKRKYFGHYAELEGAIERLKEVRKDSVDAEEKSC